MATYYFKKEFIPSVLKGRKRQTVRNVRKHPPRPGEALNLKCAGSLFGRAVITEVFPIRFYASREPMLMIKGKVLSQKEEEAFARLDGLKAAVLKRFLMNYSRTKNGWNDFLVIRWKDFKPTGNNR